MPISTAEAFEKRQITRDDGVPVLSRPLITVAAMEAGYHLPTPTVDEAVANTQYPGQMTSKEFADFCEQHQDSFVSAEELAKAVVVVAPSNVITRASLEEIIAKTSKPGAALSEEEVDALFQTLDTENTGAIDADAFMRALHGEDGAMALYEQRHAEASEGKERIAQAEREAAAKAETEEKARKAADEAQKKQEASAAAKAKAESGDAKGKGKDGEAKPKEEEKKKKASACC